MFSWRWVANSCGHLSDLLEPLSLSLARFLAFSLARSLSRVLSLSRALYFTHNLLEQLGGELAAADKLLDRPHVLHVLRSVPARPDWVLHIFMYAYSFIIYYISSMNLH